MFHRLAAWLTLACYSAIALGGQGLHLLVHEHGHDHDDDHPPAMSVADAAHLDHADHGLHDLVPAADQPLAIGGFHEHCDHDGEHCAVCQHHAFGQLFVAAPPVEAVLGVCELLSTSAPETVVCPALFSPAQPRAPPMV